MPADSAATLIIVGWSGVISLTLLFLTQILRQCASLISAGRKVSDAWRGESPSAEDAPEAGGAGGHQDNGGDDGEPIGRPES
ncbi:hypothetical protein [Streptomyces sp. BF23-19]|uniref:hypothetical protein n=1 Tax=unclassified Streptomyces TaxID=2593676 RepID=UPI0034E5DC82